MATITAALASPSVEARASSLSSTTAGGVSDPETISQTVSTSTAAARSRTRSLAARLDDLDDAGRRDALIPTCFGDRANALLLLAEHDAECQRIAAPHGDDRTRRRS
jgi:hypothetical protein